MEEKLSCPTCNKKDFETERAMKIHHKLAHNESIALKESKCSECGSKFKYYPSEKEGKYCEECVKNSEVNWGVQKLFKEDNPMWKGGEKKTNCAYCNKDISVKRWLYNSTVHNYCSKDCQFNHKSELSTKSKKNSESINKYGKNWRKARRKCLERDNYTCQMCGITKQELSQNPDVHHIRPIRKFDNPEDAHFVENLISLCRKCHKKIEIKQKSYARISVSQKKCSLEKINHN